MSKQIKSRQFRVKNMNVNQNGRLKNLKRDWRRIFSGEDPERTIRLVPINYVYDFVSKLQDL